MMPMIDPNQTIRALSQITDEGLFERLATAVLRQAVPALYGNLTHPGMNTDGKTVKSPVDGIAFVKGEDPPHMVTAHHASGTSDDLRKKWLNDPSTIAPRKGPKPTAPAGDVIKVAKITNEEGSRTPGLRVTLALTTNREPPEDLTREVEAAGKRYGINIDIWSCSRIAHYLDNDLDGEWLRKTFLGIEQQRLSKQLLHQLSLASLQSLPLMAQGDNLVDRELDRIVAHESPHPVAFLVGESGLGKTVACYKRLKNHVDQGGCGLVLTHEILATHRTLDQALDAELRKLHACLEPDAGAKARALCSPDDPLLILVEDVNWTDRPALLLERLAGWSPTRGSNASAERSDWQLYCPVWPKVLATISEEARKRIDAVSMAVLPFTAGEARAAVQRRGRLVHVSLSPLEADNLAESLGNDPLLIALYDLAQKPELQHVIRDFIDGNLQRIASVLGNITLTNYRMTLKMLAQRMLLHRRIDPTWTEIQEWLTSQRDHVVAMTRIVQDRKIVRLADEGQVERLAFRHDRVLGQILSDGVAELMQTGQLDEGVLTEPFFAEVIGVALAAPNVPAEVIERVRESNPLALFYALKLFREPTVDVHHATLRAIDTWLYNNDTHGRASRALRWAALQVLSETESSHVLAITGRLRDETWEKTLARFRNGDIEAGIQLCRQVEPGVTAFWRDRQIAHAKVRFGGIFLQRLAELMRRPDLSDSMRTGALRLAGHFAEPSLEHAIVACWESDRDRTKRLADYLWAAAECCGMEPERLLAPVCDAWAALSDEAPKEGLPSPRSNLAADHVSWAFNESLPKPALQYFMERAKRDDLHWPITYMLRGIDHPDAVEFIAREFAAFSRESEGTDRVWTFPMTVRQDWERRQDKRGKGMSFISRQRLQEIWTNSNSDKHLRRQSFLVWAATSARDDIALLQNVDDLGRLADDILWARLKRNDRAAIALLLTKIESDERGYWWQVGRFIWSDELTVALRKALRRRGSALKGEWDASDPTDWITYELVMRLKADVAEQILVEHWEHLQYSPYFVQAALYVATPTSINLAREAISRSPDARELLKYVDHHFGVKQSGHPGVSRIEQIAALEPYFYYLDPMAIRRFWDLCNERGWIDFRRKHLDARMEGKWRDGTLLDEARFFAELDADVEKTRGAWVDIWFDRYLRQGESVDKIFKLLRKWLSERKTLPALELAAAAVVHAGGRRDLDLLSIDGIEPADQAKAILEDTRFEVSRRSLT